MIADGRGPGCVSIARFVLVFPSLYTSGVLDYYGLELRDTYIEAVEESISIISCVVSNLRRRGSMSTLNDRNAAAMRESIQIQTIQS